MWYDPLAGPIELSLCRPGNTSWSYDRNLLVKKNVIDNRLREFAGEVEERKAKMLRRLPQSVGNINR
ncbi:unnamed protein product [Strongylus vulgaris]|uniref:Uncharacterized protein n=1 Tax=Strongylus vulgaris TaxID=40348 RepID=A0A3P7IPM0_STRVU|nr:unnamed protein product [Strongylus vulgaris]